MSPAQQMQQQEQRQRDGEPGGIDRLELLANHGHAEVRRFPGVARARRCRDGVKAHGGPPA